MKLLIRNGVVGGWLTVAIWTTVSSAKDSWAVAADEPPALQTLWQYALRFSNREKLFLTANQAHLVQADSRLRSPFPRLLVARSENCLSYNSGMAVQLAG